MATITTTTTMIALHLREVAVVAGSLHGLVEDLEVALLVEAVLLLEAAVVLLVAALLAVVLLEEVGARILTVAATGDRIRMVVETEATREETVLRREAHLKAMDRMEVEGTMATAVVMMGRQEEWTTIQTTLVDKKVGSRTLDLGQAAGSEAVTAMEHLTMAGTTGSTMTTVTTATGRTMVTTETMEATTETMEATTETMEATTETMEVTTETMAATTTGRTMEATTEIMAETTTEPGDTTTGETTRETLARREGPTKCKKLWTTS